MSDSVKVRLPISVEQLVQWTYAVQKADVMLADRPIASGNVGSQLEQILKLGTRVDTPGIGAAMAFAGSGSNVAEDAVTVHEVCSAYLPQDQAALVMMHGRMRSRPDPRIGARWRMEPRAWHYEETSPGSGSWLKVAEATYLNRHECWHVPVVERDRPAGVKRDREAWALWREGLATVLAVSGPLLVRHQLTDSFPEAEPWLEK